VFRTAGVILQAFQVVGIIAVLPAVECLGADTEIPTCEASIVIVRFIVVKPFEPLPGWFRQLYPKTRQASCPGAYASRYAHSAAIIHPFHNSCVTNLSERDHYPNQVVKYLKSEMFKLEK
jgi:hypothetical protein